jgi:hypothetical protein
MEHASILLDDLMQASSGFSPSQKAQAVNPYFLGSIVIIKAEKDAEAQVIDGQQRLTTVALLLSAMRVTFTDPKRKNTFSALLLEEGDTLVGTKDRCRLTLREKDHDFFEKNVLRHPDLNHFSGLLSGKLTDSQRKISENCQLLVGRISKIKEQQLEALTAFLLQHTYIVVVSTPSLESAFRIFSVLNDRGLDLTVADILKAQILGGIPELEQDAYVEKWESAEVKLGTKNFADLFSHIRMVYDRKKLRTTVLEGFRSAVSLADPKAFIDDQLLPLADASSCVLDLSYECADKQIQSAINRTLRWLLRISDRDWMPVALKILTHYESKPEIINKLLSDLERLSASMWLMRYTENDRIERHGEVLKLIAADSTLVGQLTALELSEPEKSQTIAVLSGDIYTISSKPKRTYILLRLDQALSSGEAHYEFDTITVEHVMPQTPPDQSEWLVWWPDQTIRDEAVHKIGNLALLNRRQNSAAKNWAFDVKKTKYFQKKTGGSPFQITSQILKSKTWTPDDFNTRQKAAVEALSKAWRLDA